MITKDNNVFIFHKLTSEVVSNKSFMWYKMSGIDWFFYKEGLINSYQYGIIGRWFFTKKNSLINKSKVVSMNDVTLKRSIRYPAGRRNKSLFSVTSFTRWPFTSVTIEFLYLFTWTNLGEKIPIFCWENDLQVFSPSKYN